ncbi:MAG: hypothetical protein WBX01_01855 [Nitrososphaeraceae archaeon]
MLESKIKLLLSTIPVALLGALIALVVQSAALPALAQPAQQTFFEAAMSTANESKVGSGAAAISTGPAGATQDGGGGGVAAAAALLQQGQISSSPSDVPRREETQSAVIVPPRDDNAVFSGIVTYQASRPVDLFVWNNVKLENTSAIPEEFGDLDNIVNIGGKTFALAEVGSGSSASVPFTGNAVEVVGEDDPFIVTYSLNAFPALANLASDLQSLNIFNATSTGDDNDDEG